MLYTLKKYQSGAVTAAMERLSTAKAMRTSIPPTPSAFAMEAATGSGKTVIAAAVIESLFFANNDLGIAADPSAVVLWFSDSPSLNEQSKRRIGEASSELDGRLVTIESTFKGESLEPGNVYFLNAQKMSRNANLVRGAKSEDDNWLGGDEFFERPRPDTAQSNIYDTLRATIENPGTTLYMFLDEAHRGMGERVQGRQTIVKRLISGDTTLGLPPMPVVFGISATPGRFKAAMKSIRETRPTLPDVTIDAAEVRASGLLKDDLRLFVSEEVSTDTLLSLAVDTIKDSSRRWNAYVEGQNDSRPVDPLLVVQFEDKVSTERIEEVLSRVMKRWSGIEPRNIRHTFGTHEPLVLARNSSSSTEIGGISTSLFPSNRMTVHHIRPEDVEKEHAVRVLIAKTAISTGWDCPRAEVLISYRRAVDETNVTQMLGRMVRTPLARRIDGDDVLNSVMCVLPYFDEKVATEVGKRVIEGSDDSMEIDEPLPEWGDDSWNDDFTSELDPAPSSSGGSNNTLGTSRNGVAGEGAPRSSSNTGLEGRATKVPVSSDSSSTPAEGQSATPSELPQTSTEETRPNSESSGLANESIISAGGLVFRPITDLDVRPLPPVSLARGERRVLLDPSSLGPNPDVSEDVWELFDSLPTYSIPRGGSKPVPRLLELAANLAQDQLLTDATAQAHQRLHALLDGRRVEYQQEVVGALESVRSFKVTRITTSQGGSVSTDVIDQDAEADAIEAEYRAAGRIFGAEISRTYADRVAGPDGDDDDLLDAHEIVAAVAKVPEIVKALNETATNLANQWLVETRVARKDLPDERQAQYERLAGQADRPVLMQIKRPETALAPSTFTLGDTEFALPVARLHLLADEDRLLPLDLNTWELEVLKVEGSRAGICGWYRNPDKSSTTSVSLPYNERADVWRAVRPDFVFFRSRPGGEVIADVVDPHGIHLIDALPKLRGLANFAETPEGNTFNRIESVAKVNDVWRVLDHKDEKTRKSIRSATSAKDVFISSAAHDYR